ncbi:sulfotransferase [Paraburkholderia sp. DHOC27]|uniref:tetratricopeptide repeat-containing sulfotransferase family protein n=1 Tax=Paraburkholderia sp. DHOC27 TaxID=2303330 RepID=UPI000E3E6EF0|nr:sulfotransferase [Paraburkholderia sp. DHOC27]RFU47870.1 sulfotransferase family protein [Paraburkholderia sp. DHOC27]
MTHPTQQESADDLIARGNACMQRGDLPGALDALEMARLRQPNDASVHNNLGSIYVALERYPEALQRYLDALALDPGTTDIHHNLGWVYEQMHRLEEAVKSYRMAAQTGTLIDGSYNNLANCLQALGRFDEAHEAYRRAIDIAPQSGLYYRNYVQSKRMTPDDPYFIAMQALLQRGDSLTPDNRAQLHFALGHALGEMKQNDASFDHLLKANAMYRGNVDYNEALTLGLFSQLPQLLSADVLRAKGGLGDPSEAPVFIVGMPRSGSTLIEQILASHPAVYGAGERPDFGKALVSALARKPDEDDKLHLDAIRQASAAQLTALGADYQRRIRDELPELRALRDAGEDDPFKRITDKYPFNFINVGLIHLALPNARIIHSRRGAVETCLSIFSRIFHDVPFSYDLAELGRYYRAYDALMAHWRQALPPGVMLEVQYEELVDDLEGTARRMLAHCGLDWDARCLAFHQTQRQVNTASASQVRQPIYRTSLARWRPAAPLLQPLYDALGPELANERA